MTVDDREEHCGHDVVGVPFALPTQAALGDFWIPHRGLFATGCADVDPFDAAVHSARVVRSAG